MCDIGTSTLTCRDSFRSLQIKAISIIDDFVITCPVIGAGQIATGLRCAGLPDRLMGIGLLVPKLAINHIYE